MAVVKLKNKDELDKLVALLTLRLGGKVSQQDVLDACVLLSTIHIDELENHFTRKRKLSKKRAQEILEFAVAFDYDTSKSIDEELYGDQ